MKCFPTQIFIVTAAVVVALCAANDCEFNDDLAEINKRYETHPSFIFSEPKSFHFNATDGQFEDDDTCYDDDVVVDTNFRDGLYEPSCVSHSSTQTPTRLKNYNREIKDVVNNPYYVQKIVYERCSEKNSICEHGQNTPKGFAYVCRQKYVKMTLKAFDSVTGRMFDDHFPIPSACVCEYVRLKENTQKTDP